MDFALTYELIRLIVMAFAIVTCLATLIMEYWSLFKLDGARNRALDVWELVEFRARNFEVHNGFDRTVKIVLAKSQLRYTKHRKVAEVVHDWGVWALPAPPWVRRHDRIRRVLGPLISVGIILVIIVPTAHWITHRYMEVVLPLELLFPLCATTSVATSKTFAILVAAKERRAVQVYEQDLETLLDKFPYDPLTDVVPPVPPSPKPAGDDGLRWITPRAD